MQISKGLNDSSADSFRHKGLRAQLVGELIKKGITNKDVLNAIGKIPRHLFIDSSFVKFAYVDKAFPIGAGQTISQPYTVAFQTQLLETKPGDKVLEIGTGSGYQTAILCELGCDIYTIERQPELYEKTKAFLPLIGYNRVKFFLGDGYKGIIDSAPFDAILITAGAKEIPKELLLQLKAKGGVMVVPLGSGIQIMTRIRRLSDDDFEKEEFGQFSFVPMLPGVGK